MGTASFSVGRGNKGQGQGSPTMLSTIIRTSGAYTTSTTASNLEDAGGDITLSAGEVIQIHADEDMRIDFGGTAATASTGHFIPAGEQREYECNSGGNVSIIDVA